MEVLYMYSHATKSILIFLFVIHTNRVRDSIDCDGRSEALMVLELCWDTSLQLIDGSVRIFIALCSYNNSTDLRSK